MNDDTLTSEENDQILHDDRLGLFDTMAKILHIIIPKTKINKYQDFRQSLALGFRKIENDIRFESDKEKSSHWAMLQTFVDSESKQFFPHWKPNFIKKIKNLIEANFRYSGANE